jgi:hypothetical protein
MSRLWKDLFLEYVRGLEISCPHNQVVQTRTQCIGISFSPEPTSYSETYPNYVPFVNTRKLTHINYKVDA